MKMDTELLMINSFKLNYLLVPFNIYFLKYKLNNNKFIFILLNFMKIKEGITK